MRILIIDDEESIRRTLCMMLQDLGHEVAVAADAASALREVESTQFDVAFLDVKLDGVNGVDLLPDLRKNSAQLDVVVFTAFPSIENAVDAMKAKAVDYLPKPFTPVQIRKILSNIAEKRQLKGNLVSLQSQLSSDSPPTSQKTAEPAMQRTFDIALTAAKSPATILLLGESGTGKSVLARAIHDASPRRDKAFLTISCPSLSMELLQSELFGRVKGAYTGATSDAWGKVAAAEGGTLFLDEIGELPLEIQPKLLRLVQEKQYERVGEAKTRSANVRIIAATNRNLEHAVREKHFREDLFYRLNVVTIRMPPLRERPHDLEQMAAGYLTFFSSQCGKHIAGFSPEVRLAMQGYRWPGNLRELRNVVEHAVIFASDSQIKLSDLPEPLYRPDGIPPQHDLHVGMRIPLEQLENEHIRCVLAQTTTMEEAAQVLGISRGTLYERKKKLSR